MIIVRFAGILLASWYATRTLLADVLPSVMVNHPVWTAIVFTSVVRLLDRYLLDPFVYGPLKHLPTYFGRGLDIVVEVPRGKTPLKWFKENPEADLIRMVDPTGEQRLFAISPAALRDIMSTCEFHAGPLNYSEMDH